MGNLQERIADVEETTDRNVVITQYAGKYVAFLVDLQEIDPATSPSLEEDPTPSSPKKFSLRAVAEIVEEGIPLAAQDEQFFKEELGAGIADTPEIAVANAYLTWRSANTRLEGSVDERVSVEYYRQRNRAA